MVAGRAGVHHQFYSLGSPQGLEKYGEHSRLSVCVLGKRREFLIGAELARDLEPKTKGSETLQPHQGPWAPLGNGGGKRRRE